MLMTFFDIKNLPEQEILKIKHFEANLCNELPEVSTL